MRQTRCLMKPVLLLLALLALCGAPLVAQQVQLNAEAYLTPPKEIHDAVVATQRDHILLTNLSPDGRKFLVTKSDGPPTLARLACPCLYLAEMAFDPVACRARQLWVRSDIGYDLVFHADKRTVPVQVPPGARVSNPLWSPDGARLAFFAHFPDATHICIADTETGYSRRLTQTPVLATLVTIFQWSRDGRQIQTVLLPDDGRRPMPKANGVAAEPKVRVAKDGKIPSRTYRYLLESPHDMRLLEHLVTGQVVLIDVFDGKVTKIGFPNMVRSVSMAPGEQHFKVASVKKPFSYYVPFQRFGSQEVICNLEGKSLHTLSERALQETEPQTPTDPTQPKGGFKGKGKKGGAAAAIAQPMPPQPDPDPDAPPRPATPVDADGKRDFGWRNDGAGMSFLQLGPVSVKDEKAPRNDRVMLWVPPFGKDDVKVVYETPHRISAVQYSEDCRTLFLTQTVDNQRQIAAVHLADPKAVHVIHKGAAPKEAPKAGVKDPPVKSDGGDDDYVGQANLPDEDIDFACWALRDLEQKKGGKGGFGAGLGGAAPGLLTRQGRGDARTVRISAAGEVYLTGTARPSGDEKLQPRPYIDRVNIKTAEKVRIFEGKGELFETIEAVDSDNVKLVFTTRQIKTVVPDSYMTDLTTGKTTKLTDNVDKTPWHHQLQVERFQVTRVDGFKFWVKVTTPPKHAGKLPAMFWIYPREYTDQAAYNTAAARIAGGAAGPGGGPGAANRFTSPSPRSMTMLCLLGYAVVEPDVPIVGPAGRMNDNYIPDLRNSLWAVIDALDRRGVIDRDRLALGGHSYGAFSTANALAHTPFFKAGIAGDGNYNRTLTPMSFQTERRHLWDARETYLEMSPLLHAHRINGALLMYHGMDDANVGTNPINAEHLFNSLRGLGKPAALYMYPYEGHGPIAVETNLDLWARWVAWLDMYVKNPKKGA